MLYPKCDSGNGLYQWTSTCKRSLKSGLCPGENDFMCCTSGGYQVNPPSSIKGKKVIEATKSMANYPYSVGCGWYDGPTYER